MHEIGYHTTEILKATSKVSKNELHYLLLSFIIYIDTGCETFTPLFTLTARLLNHPLKRVQTGENFGRGVGNTLRGGRQDL